MDQSTLIGFLGTILAVAVVLGVLFHDPVPIGVAIGLSVFLAKFDD
jgi:hypothetical protein